MSRSTTAAVAATAATKPLRFEKVVDIQNNPSVVSAIFSHVVMMPPYGPLIHLSAAQLSINLKESLNVEIAPSLLTALFMRNWDVDQWRQWSALYAPVDLLLKR